MTILGNRTIKRKAGALPIASVCDFPSISAQPSYTAMRRAAILGCAAAFQPPPTDTSTHSYSLFNPAPPEAGLATGSNDHLSSPGPVSPLYGSWKPTEQNLCISTTHFFAFHPVAGE